MSKRNGNGASTLKLDPHNARKHPDRNKAQIAASLKELGAGRSILVDATDTIIAGNGVYEQAQVLGYKVKVIEADGKTLIAVKRPDLKGARARRMALADNRATETSEWDVDVLADLAANDADALAGLFDERELRDLLGDKMPGGKEETADAGELVDKAAELQAKWQVQRGDVWQVGKHRVMCGDSTNAADVARLMGGERAAMVWTDPPYGISYKSNHRKQSSFDKFDNDFVDAGDNEEFLGKIIEQLNVFLDTNGSYYVCLNWQKAFQLEALLQKYFKIQAHIVWDKKHAPLLGSKPYWRRYELIWFGFRDGAKITFNEHFAEDIWEFQRDASNKYLHPTQKPTELTERAIKNSTNDGGVVLDFFLGSGTTLVACEQTGRIGRGMEIEPKYVAVTLERLSLLGLTPKRIDDANGKAKRKTKATA